MSIVYNPKVPQDIRLHALVTPGTHFSFCGKCFDKNFSFSLSASGGVVLKVDFNMETDKLIRAKSQIGENWTREVRARNPVKANESFSLHIIVMENSFSIEVNGQHLFDYKHQVPASEINMITLFNHMNIESLSVARN
ncbi:unnamed protein product [Caenorhabditis auriculariae]|uniref:Galectin n=1 Tax=Caenorhabditis auriculariae TaxID=2777116 RepID=A0A8S1GVT1_9PELO|nr:unnamed protein product [Caenorhabditis auriculariae]